VAGALVAKHKPQRLPKLAWLSSGGAPGQDNSSSIFRSVIIISSSFSFQSSSPDRLLSLRRFHNYSQSSVQSESASVISPRPPVPSPLLPSFSSDPIHHACHHGGHTIPRHAHRHGSSLSPSFSRRSLWTVSQGNSEACCWCAARREFGPDRSSIQQLCRCVVSQIGLVIFPGRWTAVLMSLSFSSI
jgi:hypothetical protein